MAFSNAWLFDSVVAVISFSVHLNVGITLIYNRSLEGPDIIFNIIFAIFGFVATIPVIMLVNLVA